VTSQPGANPIQKILSKLFASQPKNRSEDVLKGELLDHLGRAEKEFRLACRINPNFGKSLKNLELLHAYRRELSLLLR
jgi:hypothetical protein